MFISPLSAMLGMIAIQGASSAGREREGVGGAPSGQAEPLTWYQYYAPGGQTDTGLLAEGDTFTLNGKEIQIFSGAVHYFRVHPQYWRSTLRKLRAAGLNTVETYVAWNMHEQRMDVYDFGDAGGEMHEFLDLPGYLKMAQEEDLFVILRPGPYICSEWDFGGLPGYLLRQYNVHVRSYDQFYLDRVSKWYSQLLPKIADLQFTKGGPIIAVQVENEFGAFGYGDFPRDGRYLAHVRDLLAQGGITELIFTSDSPINSGDAGALPGVLQTANFQQDAAAQLDKLKELQPDRPLMTMEFWTGWYDHWMAFFKASLSPAAFREILEIILQRNSSVNMYMFMGGTNWGFMAGANWLGAGPQYAPDTTSYDYDAVLTEGGCYTEKYNITKELLEKYSVVKNIKTVDPPPENPVKAYDFLKLSEALQMADLLGHLVADSSTELKNMEGLDCNNGSGQAHGLTWYRARVSLARQDALLRIRGHVRDVALVVIDGQLITQKPENLAVLESFGYWATKDGTAKLPCPPGNYTLDILVENMGRVNYGEPHILDFQRKGLYEGAVELDGVPVTEWEVYPMEMKKDWINSLDGWTPLTDDSLKLPTLLRGTLTVEDQPCDTYLDMRQFTKGVVFVNGFNLGRYWIAGPVFTLYLPAPLLRQGDNQVVVLEEFGTDNPVINFSSHPITLATRAMDGQDPVKESLKAI